MERIARAWFLNLDISVGAFAQPVGGPLPSALTA